MKIYLAGPITGCTFDECTDWRQDFIKRFKTHGVECLSPMRGKEYLKQIGEICGSYPDFGPLASSRGIMTRDHWDCTRCDLVLFNLIGAKTVSIGTVMELAWAWDHRIPTVVAMEDGNCHEHPMVSEAIGFRVPTLENAFHVARAILNV